MNWRRRLIQAWIVITVAAVGWWVWSEGSRLVDAAKVLQSTSGIEVVSDEKAKASYRPACLPFKSDNPNFCLGTLPALRVNSKTNKWIEQIGGETWAVVPPNSINLSMSELQAQASILEARLAVRGGALSELKDLVVFIAGLAAFWALLFALIWIVGGFRGDRK